MEIEEMKQTTITREGGVIKIWQGYSSFYVPIWALDRFVDALFETTGEEVPHDL